MKDQWFLTILNRDPILGKIILLRSNIEANFFTTLFLDIKQFSLICSCFRRRHPFGSFIRYLRR